MKTINLVCIRRRWVMLRVEIDVTIELCSVAGKEAGGVVWGFAQLSLAWVSATQSPNPLVKVSTFTAFPYLPPFLSAFGDGENLSTFDPVGRGAANCGSCSSISDVKDLCEFNCLAQSISFTI